jgi:hypothetical protein
MQAVDTYISRRHEPQQTTRTSAGHAGIRSTELLTPTVSHLITDSELLMKVTKCQRLLTIESITSSYRLLCILNQVNYEIDILATARH